MVSNFDDNSPSSQVGVVTGDHHIQGHVKVEWCEQAVCGVVGHAATHVHDQNKDRGFVLPGHQ